MYTYYYVVEVAENIWEIRTLRAPSIKAARKQVWGKVYSRYQSASESLRSITEDK